MRHTVVKHIVLAASLWCAPLVNIQAEPQPIQLKLAFITCGRDAAFFVPVKKGMNDAGDMLGVQCEWMGTEGVDLKAQAELLRQAVKEGYNGVAFNIIDPEAFDGVIEEAIKAGVPVVGFNVDDHATPNPRLSSVNQRLYEAGKRLGNHVSSRVPAGSHVLLTKHDEGVSALEDRARGIQDALKEKEIKWRIIVTGNDAVKGAEVVRAALDANPDIRIVLNTGQADTEAAGLAFEAMDSSKDFWCAGFDLSPRILQFIKDGNVYCTIDQQPYIQGFYPVVQLTHYFRYGIMPSNVNAGAAVVDQSNVDAVLEHVEQNYR